MTSQGPVNFSPWHLENVEKLGDVQASIRGYPNVNFDMGQCTYFKLFLQLIVVVDKLTSASVVVGFGCIGWTK